MLFIFLSILFNAYIGIIFKYFDTYKVQHLPAIVINYWICVITGLIFIGSNSSTPLFSLQSWTPFAFIIGLLFIIVFNLIALSSVKVGITITQAANKLSLAIPVIFSFILYNNEYINGLKIIGISIALLAVWLSTMKQKSHQKKRGTLLLLPILIFLGSGIIDTLTKYVEHSFFTNNTKDEVSIYVMTTFFIAACLGSIYLIGQLATKQSSVSRKDILGGILLGVPNYFSIYFLLRALQYDGLSSSAIIPINNIGILTVVSLYGLFILKEKLSSQNKLGLGLTVIAIILIYLAG